MKVMDFLTMLRERDVQFWTDGERLRCNAPAGALTPELQQELRERKGEILDFLRLAESLTHQQRALVPLQPHGTAAPIFAVAGHNGDVFCFRAMARHLGANQPFFGLQPPGLDGQGELLARVEDLADYFARQIRAAWPTGPLIIAGYCAGGTIAFELARRLLQDAAEVTLLALFGSPFPTAYRFFPQLRLRLELAAERAIRHAGVLASVPPAQLRRYIAERWLNLKVEREAGSRAALDPVMARRTKVGNATLAAIRRYKPGTYSGRLSLFWPDRENIGKAPLQWPTLAPDIEQYFGPEGCTGTEMLREPHAGTFAEFFKLSLQGMPRRQTTCSRQPLAVNSRWPTSPTEAWSL